MGQIRKLKNSWGIRYELPSSSRNKRQQKQVSGFRTKRQAQLALNEIEAKIYRSGYHVTELSVLDMFDLFIDNHVSNLKSKTQDYYKGLFDTLISRHFEDMPVKNMKPLHMINFMDTMDELGYSDDKISKVYKMFHTCFNKAVEWEYLDSNVIKKVKPPEVIREEAKYWTPEQIKGGLSHFNTVTYTNIHYSVFMAVYLGLRLGEACALTVDDLDFINKEISINKSLQYTKDRGVEIGPPKNKSSIRTLPMTKVVEVYLLDYIRTIKENKLALGQFYSMDYWGYLSVRPDGNLMSDRYVSKAFAKLIRKQDTIPVIKYHELRHSCASWLLYNEVPMEVISKILGHSSIKMTEQIYAHMRLEQKKTALDTLKL